MKPRIKLNAPTVCFGLLLLAAVSCISEKDIRIEPVPPRPVLNALLRPDTLVTVNVSVSSRDAACSPGDIFIDDAVVDLRVNGTSRGRFEKLSSPGDYSFPGYRPAAGDRVELTACAPRFEPVTASTCIPAQTAIAGVDTTAYRRRDDWGAPWEYLDANLLLYDLPGERNYYLLSFTPHQVWRKGSRKICGDTLKRAPFLWLDIYSKEDFFLENADLSDAFDGFHSAGASFLFTDDFKGGKPFRLHFTFSNVQYSYRDDTLSCVNTCRITLRSVSESYYLYRRSKILQKEQDDILGETGLREPLPTYTNVTNGYGLLAAWQETTYELVFPFKADRIPSNNPFQTPDSQASGRARQGEVENGFSSGCSLVGMKKIN